MLLFVIGEALQQGLTADDYSLTNAFLIVATLVGINVLVSFVRLKSKTVARLVDRRP